MPGRGKAGKERGSGRSLDEKDKEESYMKKIGVLSDTHGKLREEVADILRECDVIMHAGDINTPRILEQLQKIAPVYAVRGNADKEWAKRLPVKLDERICGLRIYMVHNKKDIPEDLAEYDLVVYGHSHKYEERKEGCLYLNPGSCGPRRFSLPVTMAVIEVENDGTFHVIRKDIVTYQEGKEIQKKALTHKTLSGLLGDVDKGKSITEIAAKYGLDEETVEQICRMYLTHPGIGPAQVLDKMAMPRDR